MRFGILILICSLIVVLSHTHPLPAGANREELRGKSVTDRLVGAWRLVSVETTRPNGEVIYPFYGRYPEGLLVYDCGGWMSVQIVSDPKPTVPHSSSERGEEGVRQVLLEDNRPTLVARAHEMGEDHQRRLVWERASTSLH